MSSFISLAITAHFDAWLHVAAAKAFENEEKNGASAATARPEGRLILGNMGLYECEFE